MKIRHAFTGCTYERVDDDRVKVTDPTSGKEGIFTATAKWVSGDLKYADLHMCGAVGGKKAAMGFEAMQPQAKAGDEAASV